MSDAAPATGHAMPPETLAASAGGKRREGVHAV